MTFSFKYKKTTAQTALIVSTMLYTNLIYTGLAQADFYNLAGFDLSIDTQLDVAYDDNIYSNDANQIDDVVTTLDTTLGANWRDNDDALYLTLQGEANRYSDNASENREQYRLRSDWKHTFSDHFYVRSRMGHRRYTSMRGNPFDDPGTVSDQGTTSFINRISIDSHYDQKRYVLDFGLSGYLKEAEDTKRANGEMIRNAARNRYDIEGYLQPGYIIMPNTTAYFKAEFLARRYEEKTASAIKDTDGLTGAIGLKYYIPNRITLDAWAGYLQYKYTSDTLEDTKTPYYGAEAKWNITDQIETNFSLDRKLSSNISSTTSAIITDTVRLGLEYKPVEDFLINLSGSYSGRDYRHSASAIKGGDRWDNYAIAKLGLEYSFNENWHIGADYEYRNRDSNAANSNLERNITSIFLRSNF